MLSMYDCYKERIQQSREVKDYFLVIVKNARKLQVKTPEGKQKIEEFESKVNLQENDQLTLKQDNQHL